MTTYSYTGKLTDFGEAPFASAIPRLWVAPEGDAFAPGGPAAARRIPVTVASDGSFSVALVASADLLPPTRYALRCEWLTADASGQEVLAGWAEWVFTAAIGGGPISTMPNLPITRVWYATTAPPVNRSGIYWVHPTTGDVREWVD
ncbi:hypothetical protein [Microbacterium sp. KR10-403]|uniref:hypothetical protein n=1 Tax=Microbacterium sp. KR10-403 TaxID=3158581 RepID=UPI0032E37DC1